MLRSQASRWSQLPEELVLNIISRLLAGGQKKSAASLREACRGWHAASSQYAAALKCRQLTDLCKLCTAFPLAVSLELSIDDCSAEDLQHLTALTRLTAIHCKHVLDVSREAGGHFEPDLGEMPGSIEALKLENMAPNCSRKNYNNVTRLEYRAAMPVPGSQQALGFLLQDLPALEVLHLDTADGPQVISTQCAQSRLSQLTELRLKNGYVPETLQWPASTATWRLQTLEVYGTISHKSWMNSLFSKSTQLTSLGVQTLDYPHRYSNKVEWKLLSGLRRLAWKGLGNQLPTLLLLESFSWSDSEKGRYAASTHAMGCIAAMTKLTFLELTRVSRSKGAKQLQDLPLLQVLILRECAALGQQLLERGSFDTLRELQIHDDYPMTAEGYPDLVQLSSSETMDLIPHDIVALGWIEPDRGYIDEQSLGIMQAIMKAEAIECMATVRNLPHMALDSISGNGSLIRLGLPQGP